MSFGETRKQPWSTTVAALRFAGAIEFGSRAVGVETEKSDYDFAILRANFNQLTHLASEIRELPIENYFKVIPAYGENTLALNIGITDEPAQVDLLILEHQEHLDMVATAMKRLATASKTRLADKATRIKLHEHCLVHEGFVFQRRVDRIKAKLIQWLGPTPYLGD